MTRKKSLKWPKPAKEFDVPLYGGRVCVFKTQKALNDALDFIGVGSEEQAGKSAGTCIYMESASSGVLYFLGLFDRNRSTMVHETAHLTMFVLGRAGINPTDSGGEAFCYLQGHFVHELGIDRK